MNTIKLKYGLEEITSRIPGLFPYIEFDENHVSTIHSAIDSSVGCYGKIPCSLKIPNNVELIVDGSEIVTGGNTYTYNTLMSYYYTYKEAFPSNTFIKFMDGGIGRFKIADLLPVYVDGVLKTIDFDECILVPEYEYYANTPTLYDEYVKMKIMCDKYIEIKTATGEINCELECLLDKYTKMGGDVMLEFYRLRVNELEQQAETYYHYVGDIFDLNFNLNIVSSNNDLGLLSTFLNYFSPNEKYYKGDEVIYNDRTYVCCVEVGEFHKGPWDDSHFDLISDTDANGNKTVYIPKFNAQSYYHGGEFVRNTANQVYVCDLPATEIYHGVWSDEIFKPKNISGITNSKLTGFRNNTNYIDAGGSIVRPTVGVDWLWYYHIGDIGFYETTTDEFNNIEVTGQRVTKGKYETNLMAYGDIIIDIERNTNEKTITFTYVIGAHLKAKYIHDYLDDDNNTHYCYSEFEYDDNDPHGVLYTETFDYEVGGDIDNLSDDNFRKYVSYNKYKLYLSGTYINPGEIYYILTDGQYEQHINTISNKIEVPNNNVTYYYEYWTPARRIDDVYTTCGFNTNNRVSVSEINGAETDISYIIGDISSKFDEDKDILCSTTTKFDYLTGVVYAPDVKDDVNIRRGNAAAWERHIKLGEICTFEDLETYANNSFFNLR